MQPRVIISVYHDGLIFGGINLHRISDLACRNGPMVPDHKSGLLAKSFPVGNESKSYEACAQIVMDYIRRVQEVTYLKPARMRSVVHASRI